MTDRELMQQALEALQAVRDTPASADEIQRAWIVSDLLQRRLAQPEQEPVAWIDEFGNVFPLGAQRGPKHLNEPMKPLYTATPQRKPLTDEEIGRIAGDCLDAWSCARAIEAAHGIKGEA